MSYEEWYMDYHNKEIIDLRKYITNKELEILKKLEITIKDKVYTGYEYEWLKINLLLYYKDKEMYEEELKNVKPLKEKDVSEKQYNKILNKFSKLDKKYYLLIK